MSFSLHIQCYPWDSVGGEHSATLDQLRGEVGVDGLTVWAAVPPVMELRARPEPPQVFATAGGVFFAPREPLYARLHCQPVVSTWVRGRDPLEEIRKLCECHKLSLRVMVSASRTGRLAERYPELACRNVFGAESRESVCLNNPHVREYLVVLLGNLAAAYAPQAIVLTDTRSGWSEAYSPQLRTSSPLDEPARAALTSCFCECCGRRMRELGIDTEAARAAAVAVVTREWDTDATRGSSQPLLHTLRVEQDRALAAWIAALRSACTRPILIGDSADANASSVAADIVSIDDAGKLDAVAKGRTAAWEIRVAADFANREHGTPLVALLSEAARLGARGATMDSLGLLSENGQTSLRQAIRFARRTGLTACARA
jgi:hypothetical protein